MCWNATVSLNTYIVASFGTVFALMNGASWKLVAWFHLFSMMQLAEYFIWKNIDKPYWNTIFSSFGLFILVLEPLASMMLMEPGTLRTSILLSYIGFLSIAGILYYPIVPSSKVASNGHLLWLWQPPNFPFLFNILWILFFILPLYLTNYIGLALFATVTVIISTITYKKHGTWGTMWCWMANAIWLFIIGAIALQKCYGKTICSEK